MMSVTASAGEAKLIAIAAAARYRHLKAGFTIKTFQFSAAESRIRIAFLRSNLVSVPLAHKGVRGAIDRGSRPGRIPHLPAAARKR